MPQQAEQIIAPTDNSIRKKDNFVQKFKMVLLGESGVGKTSLALRFAKDRFNEKFDATIGAAFFLPTIWIEKEDGQSTKVKFEIWDTAGQERFRSITPMYIRQAKSAIVVYDINNRNSFVQAKNWVDHLRNAQMSGLDNKNIVIAFVGNKADLADFDRRDVEWREGQKYAAENDLIFIETSAKSSLNVKELFQAIAKVLLRNVKENEQGDGGRERGSGGIERIQGVVLGRMGMMQDEARQKVQNCCN